MTSTEDAQQFMTTTPDAAGSNAASNGGFAATLQRNEEFAAEGRHAGARVIPELGLVVITCLDPRTDPAHFLGLNLGDAFIVRNVGGRVTSEVVNDIAFLSQIAENVFPDGPLFEVAVIHHTQCGAGALADPIFRQSYADRIGLTEAILRDHAIVDPAVSVQTDVARLRATPAISGRIVVSGHVYDLVTGAIDTIVSGTALP